MLTPADVEGWQFTTTRIKEGYDQGEVDTFLDRVAREYREMQDQINILDADNRKLRSRPKVSDLAETVPVKVQPSTASVERLLVSAQKVADQARADAEEEARAIREAAEEERRNALAELEQEREVLKTQVEELSHRRAEITNWFREILNKIEEEVA